MTIAPTPPGLRRLARPPALARVRARSLLAPAAFAATLASPSAVLAQRLSAQHWGARDASAHTAGPALPHVVTSEQPDSAPRVSGPAQRLHTFARPAARERMTWFYGTVLGALTTSLANPGDPSSPMLLVRFADGGSMSVEFRDDALDDAQALRGAWAELRTDRPEELRRRIAEAGIPRVPYGGTSAFYFQAPGGQVFRIAPDGARP